ncbi:MAG: hypothetical protein IPJ73_21570 [Zoogloea sp.]|nr:hypothetical protein [Zoogloea sp.]
MDMEPWISSIERRSGLASRSSCASRRLTLDDLFEVCGEQDTYSLEDARRLHKQQWRAEEYGAALDIAVGDQQRISQEKMLEILGLRAKYIAERGATLNNPHIRRPIWIDSSAPTAKF